MNVVFYTLGCKVNQYETQIMRELLQKNGFTEDGSKPADVVIINSCTVTAESDRKTRQALNRFKNRNPNAVTVLAGCYPQALFEKGLDLPVGADILLGNANTPHLVELIEEFMREKKPINALKNHTKTDGLSILTRGSFEGKTRAFVKIEDGCNRFCSYCMVPYARGRVRSKPIEEIKKELSMLSFSGCKEVVLSGINLTAYSDEGRDLGDAVTAAATIPGIERIRLGSMEPDQLTPEIIEKLKDVSKLCGQFHLSLQSGCDETLIRMRRRYDTAFYEELVKRLRASFPDCSVTTDIMVGFPLESDEEFESSLAFVKRIGFARAHVFAYSPRKDTPAASMSGQITRHEKEKRSKIMTAATDLSAAEFIKSAKGKVSDVLFEKELYPGIFEGYTENYIQVKVKSDTDISGQIFPVSIGDMDISDGYTSAEIV